MGNIPILEIIKTVALVLGCAVLWFYVVKAALETRKARKELEQQNNELEQQLNRIKEVNHE